MADVGNLVAKLTLDSTEFSGAVDGIGEKLGSLASGIGSTLGGVTSAVGAAVGAAADGVASLVKQSVEGFADYEQLVGGAQKIFDEMDYSVIAEDAANAWQTMNISASEYLSMINSVGATFAQTMGDAQGYEVAKQGMQAIADYASGTGKDVGMLNEKFAAITRSAGTYQSIADQFAGILPSTSEAFLKQAQAAGLLSSEYEKLTDVPIAKYQQAVTTMLEQGVKDLGLAGNTVEETEKTISGSLNGLKAAWKNLITGMSDSSADLGPLIDNVVKMAKASVTNLMPAISQALKGVAELIKELAPVISAELPGLIQEVVPMLLEAAMSIVQSLTQSLPELIETIMQTIRDILPQVTDTIVSLLDILVGTILPELLDLGGELILSLAEALLNNIESLEQSAMAVIMGLIGFLQEYLPELIIVAVQIVTSIATFIAENLPIIIPAVIQMIMIIMQTLIENLPTLIMAGLTILNAILDGIAQNFALVVNTVINMIILLITTIIDHLPEILAAAIEIGLKIVAGIAFAIPSLLLEVGRMLGIVKDTQSHVDKSSQTMQKNTTTMTTGVSSDLDSMLSNMRSQTNTAKNTMKSTSNSIYQYTDDMNKKAENLVKTTDEVKTKATYAFRGVADVISLTRIDMKVAFEGMTEMIQTLEYQLEELSMVKARPEVDPSGVEEGCNAIIEAVEDAIAALNRLGAASAGGGGGGGGGGRASGGYISAGTTYLVGKLGPELITPTRSGYVHTAEETADMLGGGETIVININGDVYDDERSMRNKLKDAMLSVLEEQMAYG